MDQKLNERLEDFFKELDNSSLVKDLIYYKNKVLNNNELMDKINKLRLIDNKYCDEYKKLKLDIYRYHDYNEYIRLESELNLLIFGINKKLKDLIRK